MFIDNINMSPILLIKIINEEINNIADEKNRGMLKRTGERFWIGSVNVYDGEIEEVHTYEQAEDNDFHHNAYFSQGQLMKIKEGECMVFWINDNGIQTEWTNGKINNEIKYKIRQQIDLL